MILVQSTDPRLLSNAWLVGDRPIIDGLAVNGSAHSVGRLAAIVRFVQTGMLYHYAMAIIVGLLALLLSATKYGLTLAALRKLENLL